MFSGTGLLHALIGTVLFITQLWNTALLTKELLRLINQLFKSIRRVIISSVLFIIYLLSKSVQTYCECALYITLYVQTLNSSWMDWVVTCWCWKEGRHFCSTIIGEILRWRNLTYTIRESSSSTYVIYLIHDLIVLFIELVVTVLSDFLLWLSEVIVIHKVRTVCEAHRYWNIWGVGWCITLVKYVFSETSRFEVNGFNTTWWPK